MINHSRSSEETLVEYPCEFPIKVMGETSDAFAVTVLELIRQHAPEFDTTKIDMRASSGGKYLSLTCRIYVTSKPQLDAIYIALTSHPMIKVVL